MKENRTFKFVVEVVRRDQFSIDLCQWCYTLEITIFYGYIGFNFFPAEFNCCLCLNHLHYFLPNSRYFKASFSNIKVKSAHHEKFLKMPKGKAVAVRASWEGLKSPFVRFRDLSGPEDVANWAEMARCIFLIQGEENHHRTSSVRQREVGCQATLTVDESMGYHFVGFRDPRGGVQGHRVSTPKRPSTPA